MSVRSHEMLDTTMLNVTEERLVGVWHVVVVAILVV